MPDQDIRIGHLIPRELLDALQRVFPMRRPLPEDTERRIWISSGNQEVIEFLQRQHDDAISQSIEA